jgi:hopene-associated glycosyltransferase HpnB
VTLIAALTFLIWIGMATLRGGFWTMREIDASSDAPNPAHWPPVVAIVPARDEAQVIARSVASLAAQDYPGDFRIILVDDNSSDGTGNIARSAGGERLSVITGAPLALGWTGKLWAVSQGVTAAGDAPAYLWLTDADIAHSPDNLRRLVARAEACDLAMVSLMARLNCASLAERALIPAFVFFFQLLYPFAHANRPGYRGAAAGGCMLVNRAALAQSGGIAAIRAALIDDCALGANLKQQGPIWLGLTDRALSIRPYPHFADVAAMISRSAYAQLHYNPLLLAGTLLGLALVYLSPPLIALAASGPAQWLALATWGLMALLFQPILRFYRRSPLWGLALPAIAAYYSGCTFLSAWQHVRGRGGFWKGRVQAAAGR